jgi:hypothetical protein
VITTRRVFGALSAALIIVALVAMRPSGEPGVPLRDFSAYYSAGLTWATGGDPYSSSVAKIEQALPGARPDLGEMLPYFGMPAALPLFALFGKLPYATACIVWGAFLALALGTLLFALRALLSLTLEQTTYTALLLLSFVPITSGLTLGQSALLAETATLLTLLLPSVPFLIFAALQPAMALSALAMLTTKRGAISIIIAAVIVYALGALASGFAWPLAFAKVLLAASEAERFDIIQYTPISVFYGFGIPENLATALGLTVLSFAAAIAAYAFARATSLLHRFTIIAAATPFLTGFEHEHNFVVLVVPMILCLLAARHAWLAIIACSLVSINWLDFAQQPQGVWQDVTLAAGFLCACAALSCGTRSKAFARGAPIALIFIAIGAYVGTHHPLPIWPNDMTTVYGGANTLAADLWKKEQLQTGLLRPDAAAALLRSFALLGSALLFYLILDIDVQHIVER